MERRPLLILSLAAFIAVLPLILRGCSCGHDFDFHLISWFEAARQFSHGTLHPHWAFTPAWNAGEPRFVFYPPLSWIAGALLGLLMPWSWAPIVYTWLALTAAGASLYLVARRYTTPNAALVAAAAYLANPYTLYTAYERTAYAELLAAAWFPLLLQAALERRISIPRIALPVALLWLTNAPAAVMGCYTLALLLLLRIGHACLSSNTEASSRTESSPTTLTLHSSAGVLLGLGLASFYLIPAAYERRYVQIKMAILTGLRPEDNFLFHHTSDPEHDLVLHLASLVAVALIAPTVAALLSLYRQHASTPSPDPLDPPGPQSLRLSLTVLTGTILFLLTPLSVPLWRYLPELSFLQFPWRLLAVLATLFGLALAQTLGRVRLSPARTIALVLLASAGMGIASDRLFRQRCYPEDTVPARLEVFRSTNPGTDPTDEYTPIGADNDTLSEQNPGYWLAPSATSAAPPSSSRGAAPRTLELSLPSPATLILNLRNYPAWHITRNGIDLPGRLPRKDGLIALPVPAGQAHIEITYTTPPDQWIGYALSALALTFLLLSFRKAHAA
jgi:uncharacterized membrane protein